MNNKCQDCGKEVNRDRKFCYRCLAIWHIENDIDDNAPCADFDEPISIHGEGEY